ncbi:MAG: DUF5616 domain-containing protein, partial [Planctomycetes bacterium]|nr:DUF5616 domain-containing protein [Planctomycetota bacterium]
LAGKTLVIDGFNVLVTLEAALSGGVILAGRDGCFRDMASMHGTYRRVAETTQALTLLGEALESLGVVTCRWLFDRPVSNSGRVQALASDLARERGWSWEVQLVQDPDRELAVATNVIASADSGILNRCGRWFSLAQYVVEQQISTAWLVDFRDYDSDVL